MNESCIYNLALIYWQEHAKFAEKNGKIVGTFHIFHKTLSANLQVKQ